MIGCPPIVDPGLFRCGGATLGQLLRWAYGLSSYQFEGPASLDSDKYDIEATIPPGARNEQVKLMLQNLLVERFGLVVHRETREMPIYELVVAKGGLKMKTPEKPPAGAEPEAAPAEGGGGPPAPRLTPNKDGLPEFPPGVPGMFVTHVSGTQYQWLTARMKGIADLLNMLQIMIGRPVVDKTGLTGVYDFNLRYAISSASRAGSAASAEPPSGALDESSDFGLGLFGAFESQLGLKLEPKRGPVEVLVVDRANRMPTEN
jgi:uncharacterized protein (TIGR03435 family)